MSDNLFHKESNEIGPQKILMLGGSAQQTVAIQAAKDAGYYTVVCDYLPDNPGQHIADKFYPISTTDVDAVYKVASSEKVDGILAYASDPAALPAAIVAERLGLPTNPVSSVEILGVKHRFRQFLKENGFACPRNKTFHPDVAIDALKTDISTFSFPIIVKPTDSSGSKGVTKLYSVDGLAEAISHANQYSRNKILIVEEFIEFGFPEVIGGDIFVWDGKIILYGEMSCTRGDNGRSLIPIGKKKPSGLNERQTEIVHLELQKLIDALGIRFGELNIEIILDKEDNVHFLELGPRAGGNMIPIQLSDAYGVNLPRANVLAAMGKDPRLHPTEPSGCYMTSVLHSDQDGIFNGVWYSDDIKQHVYREVLYKKAGDNIERFDGAGKAIGIVFMAFTSSQEMSQLAKEVSNHIKIELS